MLFSRRWLLAPALLVLPLLLVVANEYATARPSRRTQDVAYVPATDPAFDAERHVLDVYAPRQKAAAPYPVVVFIHGGSWNSGNKNFYSFVGRRLAKQGVVAVVINYRLSPKVEVPAMADDCARAVVWATEHIREYGGNPQRLFVMGHSAGGGLAALLAADNRLFERRGLSQNPIKGAILDDPAGLDMLDYLTKLEYPHDEQYLIPYGKQPAVWKDVSALYHVTAAAPPFLVFIGGETYPSIRNSSRKLEQKLITLGHPPLFTVLPGKKHAPMVLQLYWKDNVIYQELLKMVR
ncbi:alpha/beta hydrolase [Hymenobacter sp. BT186]|uniref:Alpha/beta hydrolase n=1 Tax=Hymenobacter telluris TaxID=2816474 RepID=A0A939EXR5_9BACT|nr:alpha/beta hydrolase [Hymenobacter telluris]MBO0359445.1 alpha/beta hydrolase [Hymenobacter telluris]MBW3375471.1 alpha/beta hydrolase [Hymenobacter norwichensis]